MRIYKYNKNGKLLSNCISCQVVKRRIFILIAWLRKLHKNQIVTIGKICEHRYANIIIGQLWRLLVVTKPVDNNTWSKSKMEL